ncbi:MAG: hypoxanthine-guanine phosphoribosyltransferase [Gammaproteobacteria bacterium]
MSDLLAEIGRVQREAELLHSEQVVQAALKRLAESINKRLVGSNPLVVCVMTGGLVPTGWLLPMLNFPLQLDYIHATRYREGTRGHDLEWRIRPRIPVHARTVLLVDDIYDEGVTLTQIVDDCRKQGAHQVFTAVLIRKQRMHNGRQPNFVGLEAPDRYLFGCGLDYKNYLRNLSAVYAIPDDFDKDGI